jgi:hypothetical protein
MVYSYDVVFRPKDTGAGTGGNPSATAGITLAAGSSVWEYTGDPTKLLFLAFGGTANVYLMYLGPESPS